MSGRTFSKTCIAGFLKEQPVLNYMPSGDAVCNIVVATDDVVTDKLSGEKKTYTEWHRIVLFKRKAEIAAQYLFKGSHVYIEGSNRTTKYQDKETGQDRYSTQIMCKELQFLDAKPADEPSRDVSTISEDAERSAPCKNVDAGTQVSKQSSALDEHADFLAAYD